MSYRICAVQTEWDGEIYSEEIVASQEEIGPAVLRAVRAGLTDEVTVVTADLPPMDYITALDKAKREQLEWQKYGKPAGTIEDRLNARVQALASEIACLLGSNSEERGKS